MGPEFTSINYIVCNYCNYLMKGFYEDVSIDGCKRVQNPEGQYARLTFLGAFENAPLDVAGIDYIDSRMGCEHFRPNGVQAHPAALERLIQKNFLCDSIPSDPDAMETSWDFFAKVNRYLPKENLVSFRDIQ
ncbi:MAG: hypothetical protein R6V53_03695 [Candidatus Woesearchaeota archaeon]